MEQQTITHEERCVTAREVFADSDCQVAALAVLRCLQDAARFASVSSVLYLAKIKADEELGNATPEQVLTWLNMVRNILADVAEQSSEINRQMREIEGR